MIRHTLLAAAVTIALSNSVISADEYALRRTRLGPPMGVANLAQGNDWNSDYVCSFQVFGKPKIPVALNFTTYMYSLSQERLAKSPDWDESDPNPPVSARDALKLAKAAIKTHGIEIPDRDDQTMSQTTYDLQLQSYRGKWVWAVIFHPTRTHAQGPIPAFVLMDRTVLEPTPFPPRTAQITNR